MFHIYHKKETAFLMLRVLGDGGDEASRGWREGGRGEGWNRKRRSEQDHQFRPRTIPCL